MWSGDARAHLPLLQALCNPEQEAPMRAAMHALGCGGDAVVPTLLEKGNIVIFLDLRAVRLANPKIITISDIMFNAARAHINQNVSAAITCCFCSCCLMPVAADRMGLAAGRTSRAISSTPPAARAAISESVRSSTSRRA